LSGFREPFHSMKNKTGKKQIVFGHTITPSLYGDKQDNRHMGTQIIDWLSMAVRSMVALVGRVFSIKTTMAFQQVTNF